MPSYTFIDNDADFFLYLTELQENKHQLIALDIESNQDMHAYGKQLCLIQIYDSKNNIIVDPYHIDDSLLAVLFEDRNILKVMYDAPSDISLLVNTKNIYIKSILDLRPGVELLDYDKKDLHSVILTELGITLQYKDKFQRYNWLRRPISKDALEYARNDVIYLIKLKDIILNKIFENKLLDSFILRNLRLQNRDYFNDPKDKYRKVKGFHTLKDEEKSLFQQLHAVREKYAEKVNMPAAYLISNRLLLDIAQNKEAVINIRFPKRFSDNLKCRIIQELEKTFESAS